MSKRYPSASDLAADHWNAVLTIGVVLLSVSGAVLSYALIPRMYGLNPDTKKLHDRWMTRDAEYTHWVAVQAINRAIAWNEAILTRKALALRVGTLVLAVSVACIGGRLIYLLET